MSKISDRFKKLIVLFSLMILLIIFGLAFYKDILGERLSASTEATLAEIVDQQKFNLDTEMQSEIKLVKNMALSLIYMPNDKDKVLLFMKEAIRQSKFEHMIIAHNNGVGLANDGTIVNIKDRPYFDRVSKGQMVVMDLIEESSLAKKSASRQIVLAVPIYHEDVIIGVLACSYDSSKLEPLLLPSFGGKGYSFVINGTGDVLATAKNGYLLSEKGNLFEALREVEFANGHKLEEVFETVRDGRVGRAEYRVQGNIRHVYYAPLKVNNWYIYLMVPDEVVAADSAMIIKNTVILAVCITIGFAIFIFYILRLQRESDIERIRHTDQLERVAYYDELTNLPNINKFRIEAQALLDEHIDQLFVVAKFDIVNFKMVNEVFDFAKGDQVVKLIAQVIMQSRQQYGLMERGLVARVNADEFILLDPVQSLEETERFRKIFETEFHKAVEVLLGDYKVELRYGRFLLDNDARDINDIIEKVNLAHRLAKAQKNRVVYEYDEIIKQELLKKTLMESHMAVALAEREFKVYLQPKYDLNTEQLVGAEALVRWQNRSGEMISPGEFIPLFERNGFVVQLDMYMLERTCEILRGWIAQNRAVIPISVNFSRLHLRNHRFVEDIADITKRYDVPNKYIEIELTESTVFDNEEVFSNLLTKLHSQGFMLSMDDFGTGYSSLGLLRNLPVDTIKIDRSFFSGGASKEREKIVIKSVIELAKKLHIHTVAEGVETVEHVSLLREIGCDRVQGFFYGRPVPEEEFFTQNGGGF